MNPTDALQRLAEARVGTLSTVRPDGSPHVVPVVFAVAGEEVFTAVDRKPKTTSRLQRLTNIRAEPRVGLLTHHYSEDWNALWWVRIEGRATVIDEGPTFDEAIQVLAAKYAHYREQPPPGPVIVITVQDIAGWAASKEK